MQKLNRTQLTSGIINFKTHMNLVGIQNVPLGNIALLCQSGNMALTLITEAMVRRHEGDLPIMWASAMNLMLNSMNILNFLEMIRIQKRF